MYLYSLPIEFIVWMSRITKTKIIARLSNVFFSQLNDLLPARKLFFSNIGLKGREVYNK